MRTHARELVLVALVVALMLALTVPLRRADELPTPPAMMTFVAAPPPQPDATPGRCPADGRDCAHCCAAAPCAPR